MADVFISYARPNEAVAKRVAKALSASGLEVWWDEQLPAHRAYSEVIEQRLRDAKAVVVLWSKDAAQSEWVRSEADFARTNRKLVQAQLDGGLPPMPFNQVQCASLKGWRGQASHGGFSKLLASVQSLVSGDEGVAPAPAPQVRWWQQRRFQAAAAAGVLLLVAAAFLLSRFMTGGSEERPILAVLPFESLDQRDSSLVAGIWEDTRQAISRNPQILVLGPNTAEELAERGMDATKRAADYVLEASVRSVGDRIRVNTNLVRAEDGAQLWSENFDRKLDDVFALQSEIAGEIEGRIRGRLARSGGVQPEHIATSGEVYALYSDARARFRRREMGPEFAKLSGQLQRVVELDPNFAPGWATLAVIKAFFEGRDLEGAEADARRAIALAPNLAAGHAALGFVLRRGPAAEASLRRAVALDPNDYEALNWLAGALDESRSDEKLQLLSRIIEIEPLWWPAVFNKLNLLKKRGSIEAVEGEIERLGRLGDKRMATALKITLADERGDLSQAVAMGVDYYRGASPQDRNFIANFLLSPLFRIGMPEVADNVLTPPSDFVPYIRKNDPKALDMIEAQKSPRDFWTFGPLPVVAARVYLLNGQGPRLAKRYRAVASSPEQFGALVGRPSLADIAPGVALALRSDSDEVEARQLLELAQSAAEEYPTTPLDQEIRLARIYAVQGRKDEALAKLSSAVQRGWLPPYLPIHTDIALDPPLAELNSDPRFERIRQRILGHVAKERAELGPVRLD